MKKLQTYPWDAAEHLETKEDIAAYLEAALEDGDPNLVVAALGDIARSKGMTHIARETGLGRESLYKALSSEGNPEFATVLKVIQALDLRLRVTPVASPSIGK
ncbi:MAG: putative addiction module antidote protein [Xenococcaceae cyanobacterium MO_167.B52]|nr:putative addiction module antidote protein [Xenococcaceae cyanobacterium MO_167.B52]